MRQNDKQPCSINCTLSRRFASLSFFCALCIVYLHTGAALKDGSLGLMVHRMIRAACRVAIPWFFLSAGYFLAGHMNEVCWWRAEIYKRIKTLLVPFWIWSTIICLTWVICAIGIRIMGYSYRGPDAFQWVTPKGLLTVVGLDIFHTIPMMWFLRTLFILVVMSPVLRKVGWVFVVLYAIYKACYDYIGVDSRALLDGILSLRGFAYFSTGLWLRFNWRPMSVAVKLSCSIVGWLFLFMSCYCNGVSARVLDVVMVPLLLVFFFWVSQYVKIHQKITSMSCPLYLIHGVIAYLTSAAFGLLGHGSGRMGFGCGLISFVAVVVVSICVAVLLSKCFPKFAHVAFGGR